MRNWSQSPRWRYWEEWKREERKVNQKFNNDLISSVRNWGSMLLGIAQGSFYNAFQNGSSETQIKLICTRVVISFPLPGVSMQRFLQFGYLNRFNWHHWTHSSKAFIKDKWYDSAREKCGQVSEVPETFHARAPQRTLFTHNSALVPKQTTNTCVSNLGFRTILNRSS